MAEIDPTDIRRTPRVWTLGELAASLKLEIRGNPATQISAVAPLETATAGSISFLANTRHRRYLSTTHASVVVVSPQDAENCAVDCLLSPSPHVAYARVVGLMFAQDIRAGVHPSAVVDPSAIIDPTAHIAANTTIAAGVCVGPGTYIGPGCVIDADATIGADCRLVARVYIGARSILGARVVVDAGAVIGSEGFGFANDAGCWVRVPQLGRVVIGDDCEIGANTTIDCGALEDTVLEQGVKLDNQIQIAHNCHIGANTAMAACVGVAGSTRIGKNCTIGGGTGINGHIVIGDGVHITGFTMVTKSLSEPGVYSSGMAVTTNKKWRRNHARFQQLDEMGRRLKALEEINGITSRPSDDESAIN